MHHSCPKMPFQPQMMTDSRKTGLCLPPTKNTGYSEVKPDYASCLLSTSQTHLFIPFQIDSQHLKISEMKLFVEYI